MPIKIGEAYYYEGNEAELAAVGNVAVATIGERLFLRGPLVQVGLAEKCVEGAPRGDHSREVAFPLFCWLDADMVIYGIFDLLLCNPGIANVLQHICVLCADSRYVQ